MESKLSLTIRTASNDRRESITAPPDVKIDEILSAARERWNLPSNYEYVVRSERLGSQMVLSQTLEQAGLLTGDVLEVQPLADAGVHVMEGSDVNPAKIGGSRRISSKSNGSSLKAEEPSGSFKLMDLPQVIICWNSIAQVGSGLRMESLSLG